MFNARSKIIKKGDAKVTDLEDECAKQLVQLENTNANLKEHLAQVFINSAELVEYEQVDGSKSKTLFVRVPYRSLFAFRKVAEKVVAHLTAKFNWPVVVIANRTIISKHGKSNYFLLKDHNLNACDDGRPLLASTEWGSPGP
jgi:hypothetical protein